MLEKELPLHTRKRGVHLDSEKSFLKHGKESHLPSERATVVPHVGGGIQSPNCAS